MCSKLIFTSDTAKHHPNIIHGFARANDDANGSTNKYKSILLDLGIPDFKYHTVNQVHKATVMVVDGKRDTSHIQADAMVTTIPGLLLCIKTADCAPILLFEPKAQVVAAIHAGWSGAYNGVVTNTIAAMIKLGANKDAMVACIGPTIQQQSYEVDENFKERFCTQNPQAKQFFVDGKPGHYFFDLPGYCTSQLRTAGVGTIDDSRIDTYSNELLYSYRRSTHQGYTGPVLNQVSAIAIAKAE
ncbi:MAG: peptidoglycan editing factor PgeF [Proteobacteria bacterium]|nr:peptidoglycan editing factor PgeF [Pseudomonadota bacterium]